MLHNHLTDFITNLTDRILSNVEVEILKYGLKQGIASGLSECEMKVTAENIWDEIERNDLCENLMIIYVKGKSKNCITFFHLLFRWHP